jgi:hypothetical protein
MKRKTEKIKKSALMETLYLPARILYYAVMDNV